MCFRFFYAALIVGVVLSLSATSAKSMPVGGLQEACEHEHSCGCQACNGDGTDELEFDFVEVGKWDVDRDISTTVAAGEGASVTFSFVTSDSVRQINTNSNVTPIADALPRSSEAAIRNAFAAWSEISNITFTEVADSGLNHFADLDANRPESGADIRIGAFALDGAGSTRARTNVRSVVSGNSGLREYRGVLITFDLDENWAIDSIDGDRRTLDVFTIAAHEIGHAIGLNHTNVPNSLMNTGSAATESFRGPQTDDIAGAQFLYGAPVTAVLLGDVNLDGAVNFLDIAPFVSILAASGSQAEADIDENGVVNFLDIAPFVALLTGG